MAIIENIPEQMITEHINWHTRAGNPSRGGRQINPWPPTGNGPTPGSGAEFLNWHEGYIQRFREWVESLSEGQRPATAGIAPWQNIPSHLKMGMNGWNATLAREEALLQSPSNFGSLDEVGRFVEWSLHSFLHSATTQMHNEPVLLSFSSPRSTYFWQLHGLVDKWRSDWIAWQDSQDTDLNDDTEPIATSPFRRISIGERIEARIGQPGEVDRFRFAVDSTGAFAMQTHGETDTVLYLAGPDDPQRLVDSNDDGGEGRNAMLRYRMPVGTYYMYVVHFSDTATGNYEISVSKL